MSLAKRAVSLRRRGYVYREIGEELGISEGYAHTLVNGRPEVRRKPTGKRLHLSPAGELRALWRLCPELDPEIRRLRGAVMAELEKAEILDAYVKVDGADRPIYVSPETSQAIYNDAWAGLEKNLVDANAAYNANEDEPHERALVLLQSLQEAARFADVVFSLTAMPDPGEIDGGDAEPIQS